MVEQENNKQHPSKAITKPSKNQQNLTQALRQNLLRRKKQPTPDTPQDNAKK